MSKTFRLDCQNFNEIPSLARIQEYVLDEQFLVLQFPVSLCGEHSAFEQEKQQVIEKLKLQLPEFSVFNSGSDSATTRITILKVIATQDVLANVEAIIAAIQEFRKTAQRLILRLAYSLEVSPDAFANKHFRLELPKRGMRMYGTFEDWKYAFHGVGCWLENRRTGQTVEVILGYKDEFGVLDAYFLLQFIKTTPGFETLVTLFKHDSHDMFRVFEVLEANGYLKRIMDAEGSHIGLVLA